MKIQRSGKISGVVIVTPDVHVDSRGCFLETFRKEWIGGGVEMIQSNRADRSEDSLVGMHYHLYQADYWYVPFGRAMVALHDLRMGSPTEGSTLTLDIGKLTHQGVYIPPGVAHGFYARTDMTITYLTSQYYDPEDELGVIWNDADMYIPWPTINPVLSNRDKDNPRRSELELIPVWSPHV